MRPDDLVQDSNGLVLSCIEDDYGFHVGLNVESEQFRHVELIVNFSSSSGKVLDKFIRETLEGVSIYFYNRLGKQIARLI